MQPWIDWLNQNSGAVLVLVTAVYAFFTILLWRATRDQAEITRQIFEASHRPYVILEVKEPTDTSVQGRLSFNVVFENRGTVPADITSWKVRGTLMDQDGHEQLVNQKEPIQSPVGRSLAPRELATIEVHFAESGLPNPSLPFRFRGRVEYQGVASWTYTTDFDAERVGESWKMQGRKMR